MKNLHPRDIWFHLVTHLDAGVIIGSALAGSTLLLIAGGIEKSPLRNYYFAGSAVLATSGKRGRAIFDRTEPMMSLAREESLLAQRSWVHSALNPSADVIDESVIEVKNLQPIDLSNLGAKNTLIIGESGSGKSTIAKALAQRLGGKVTVIDPHNKRRDWGSLPVVGGGRNFKEIDQFLAGEIKEIDSRYKLRNLGIEDYQMEVTIVDESPAIAANTENWPPYMKVTGREARKVLKPVVILAQDENAKTLAIEGEAILREGFDRLYLGRMAHKRAKALKNEVVIQWLKQQDRPALLNDQPCSIKDLSDFSLMASPLTSASLPPATEAEAETTGNPPEGEASSEKEVKKVPEVQPPLSEVLEDDDLLAEITRLKGEGWRQTQIIGQLWGLKKDKAGKYSGRAYRKARAKFKEFTGE